MKLRPLMLLPTLKQSQRLDGNLVLRVGRQTVRHTYVIVDLFELEVVVFKMVSLHTMI